MEDGIGPTQQRLTFSENQTVLLCFFFIKACCRTTLSNETFCKDGCIPSIHRSLWCGSSGTAGIRTVNPHEVVPGTGDKAPQWQTVEREVGSLGISL